MKRVKFWKEVELLEKCDVGKQNEVKGRKLSEHIFQADDGSFGDMYPEDIVYVEAENGL